METSLNNSRFFFVYFINLFFRLENRVEKLDVSDTTRSLIKDALRAANTGLFRQDCSSVYSKCSIILSSRKP